jgi:hypothetical protein
MAAKVPNDKSLPGALKTVPTKDAEGNVTGEEIEQADYGVWPYCQLCQPARQVDPVQWSNHANAHVVPVD